MRNLQLNPRWADTESRNSRCSLGRPIELETRRWNSLCDRESGGAVPDFETRITEGKRGTKRKKNQEVREALPRSRKLTAGLTCRQVYLGRCGSLRRMGGLELAGRLLLLLHLLVDHRLRRYRARREDLPRARPRAVLHHLLDVPDAR